MADLDADREWTDSPAVLFRQRVMLAMTRSDGDCVDIAAALVSGPAEVSGVFGEIIADGLAAHSPFRAGDTDPQEAFLTPAGVALVRSWDRTRTPARLRRACMAALLSWLDANDGRSLPSTAVFSDDSRGHFYGEPFSPDVTMRSARELKKLDLIRGIDYPPDTMMQPSITPLGHMVHDRFGGDITAWMASSRGGDTININNSTGIAVANRSPHSHQTVQVNSQTRDDILTIAAALNRLVNEGELQPADRARAYGLVEQLKEVVDVVDTDPSRVRRLLGAAKAIAVNAAGSASAVGLVELIDQVTGTF